VVAEELQEFDCEIGFGHGVGCSWAQCHVTSLPIDRSVSRYQVDFSLLDLRYHGQYGFGWISKTP
jgi:hypothetical protein